MYWSSATLSAYLSLPLYQSLNRSCRTSSNTSTLASSHRSHQAVCLLMSSLLRQNHRNTGLALERALPNLIL